MTDTPAQTAATATDQTADQVAARLIAACEAEDDAPFLALLDTLPDINAGLPAFGRTVPPLQIMLTSEGRSLARLDALLARGARADLPGSNPLRAIPDYSFGDDGAELAAMVQRLVAAGADIDGAPGEASPLTAAILAGSAAETRALLAAGANPDQGVMARPRHAPQQTPERQSLLRLGAVFPDIVRALLDYGARLDGSGLVEHVEDQLARDTGKKADRPYFERLQATRREIAAHLAKAPGRPT